MTDSILRVEGVNAGYGQVQVLNEVNIHVPRHEIVCLIGSNGAGKSTLLRALSGLVTVSAGSIRFDGAEITDCAATDRVALGLVHVPEGRRLFAGMTVRENLLMGSYLRKDRAGVRRDLECVLTTFPRLRERLSQDAITLSGGEQQMCAIGRGLMSSPKLLMIDELSLGLSPKLVVELGEALVRVNAAGLSILLVEQDVTTALRLAGRGFVLDTGRIVLDGPSGDLAADPRVREAYLGQVAA